MVGFSPFVGQVIRPEFVRRVPAPAFDSMNAAQRTAYLDTHPESYTLVTRSPGDGGPEDDAPSYRLLELGEEALGRIVDSGAFHRFDEPAFFLLRLQFDGHSQVGIVGLVDAQEYLDGHVKRHEQVAADRALHLSMHFERLGAQSSPIALGYRPADEIAAEIERITAEQEPVVDFVSGDGLGQTVWAVSDAPTIDLFRSVLATRELYIMDGHHRAAAAGELLTRIGPERGGHVLGVVFGADALHIEPFHRRVRVPHHLEVTDVHDHLVDALGLIEDDTAAHALPAKLGEVGVYSAGRWWRGELPVVEAGALGTIDPVRLQLGVLGPIFEIDPERPEGLISYFLEKHDRVALAADIDDDEILFVLQAVTPEQIFAVADAGADMPPKSTYVTPKPRSGVFLRRF